MSLAAIAAAPATRVGPKTSLTGQIVATSPQSLANAAGLPLDVYALARLVNSEYGSGPPAAMVAIAEAARNRAKLLGQSIAHMLTYEKDSSDSGFFGRQSGRWAATTLDPTQKTVLAARMALEGSNYAGGALWFFSPKAQDGGTQAGQTLKDDAIEIIERWGIKGGQKWISSAPLYREGVDPYKLMIFGKVSAPADVREAVAVVLRRREGLPWSPPAATGGVLLLALGVGVLWWAAKRR
jgi:hypothetical protein